MGTNDQKKEALFFNPRCGLWSCPVCSQEKREYWTHQAMRGAMLIMEEGREVHFVTLTSRAYATPGKSLFFFKRNWPKLSERMRYKTNKWKAYAGKEWAYFLVPERHKTGVLHAHILAATHIYSERIWKDNAYETGFGYIADVEDNIQPDKAASYISKYLTKQSADLQWPKNFMRVRHSRNWPVAKQGKPVGWEWATLPNPDDAWLEKQALINQGWHVTDRRERG